MCVVPARRVPSAVISSAINSRRRFSFHSRATFDLRFSDLDRRRRRNRRRNVRRCPGRSVAVHQTVIALGSPVLYSGSRAPGTCRA